MSPSQTSLKNLFSLFLLVFLCNVALSAQDTSKPDLSGTWKLNLQKSKLSKTSHIDSEILVIKCSGLAIEMSYTTDGKESKHSYIADGKEKTTQEVQGGEIVAKARWKGAVLIVETEGRLKCRLNPTSTVAALFTQKTAGRFRPTGVPSVPSRTIPRPS